MQLRRIPAFLVLTILVATSLAASCGDDEGGLGGNGGGSPDAGPTPPVCVETAVTDFPEGLFASPADFDRAGCSAGTLDGVDPTGLWFMVSDPQGKFSPGPVRFSLTCGEGVSAAVSSIATATDYPLVSLTNDDLFYRQQRDFMNFSIIDSFDICGVDGDGNLVGKGARCFTGDFGEQCRDWEFAASPFGRLPGETEADGIELVSEYAGPADAPWPEDFTANVAVDGDIAFVARGGDALRIVDVSDPTTPVEIASFPAESDNFNDLGIVHTASKKFVLLASQARGVIVLDVSDPAAPKNVGRFETDDGAGVHRLYVDSYQGQVRAYIADGSSTRVGIFDVTDPASPLRLGVFDTGNQDWGVHAAFAKEGRLYVNATAGGLIVVDAADPTNMSVVGQYQRDGQYSHASMPLEVGGKKIVLHGDEGYDAPLEIIDDDESSPDYMKRIGLRSLRKTVSIHNMQVVGNKAYIAHYQDGLRIVDLTDPTAPVETGYFNTWDASTDPGGLLEGAVDLEVQNGFIYMAETPRGLLIFRETAN